MNTQELKSEFGKRFRTARDAKKLSRAALGQRLGISPKTIQSWEMGRTFVENLSLIPAIEAELGVRFAYLMAQDYGDAKVAEPGAPAYGTAKSRKGAATDDRAITGPATVALHLLDADKATTAELEKAYVASPVVKPKSARKKVADLTRRDIDRYCQFPGEWCPRGRVVVAFRMAGASMEPAIMQGALVLVDRRSIAPERLHGRFAALWIEGRGLRIRRVSVDPDGTVHGRPEDPKRRGAVVLDEEAGDQILGRVLGVLNPAP